MKKGKRRFVVLSQIPEQQEEFLRIHDFLKSINFVLSERTIRRMINNGEIVPFSYPQSNIIFVCPREIKKMAKRNIYEQ